MKKIIKRAAALVASAVMALSAAGGALTVCAFAASKVSVSASHASGAYMDGFTLSFEKDKGAKLYYTTDGRKPTTSCEQVPDEGIAIDGSCTVRVLASRKGAESFYTYDYFVAGYGDLYHIKNKYYYQKLSAKQKKAYERLVKALSARSDTVKLAELKISPDDFLAAENAVYYECPEYCLDWDLGKTVFGASNEYMADGKLGYYSATKSEANKIRKKVEKTAAALLERLKAMPDDLDKVRYTAEYIICSTAYSDSDPSSCYCAAGPLINGKGVCKGYSDAFTYIIQALEIPVIDIHAAIGGDGPEAGGHAANMVCIGGKWSNIDVTWCDAAENANIRYDYFLTNDKVFSKTHSKDYGAPLLNPVKLPAATSNECYDAVTKQAARAWSPTLSFCGKADFTINTKEKVSGTAFSFSINNKSHDLSYIQRTFETEPNTKYRLCAYVKYSGYEIAARFKGQSSGACIGKPDGSEHSAFVAGSDWKKLSFEFTTGADERLTALALFNGMWASDCKGKALFCGVVLEKYKNGRWITDDSSSAIGMGFSNHFAAQKKLPSLSFSEIPAKEYTGRQLCPDILVKDGGTKLIKGQDYTLSYKNNKSVGEAEVTVSGTGLYTGTKTLSFDIIPAQPVVTVTKKDGKAYVSWEKSAGADGAFVYVSVDGRDFELIKTVEGKTSVSVKLASGHSYQFAVCAYKSSGSKTLYSEYTYSQTV